MSTKETWKEFQDQFQKLSDKNKSVQNNLKKIDSLKKSEEGERIKDNLVKELEAAKGLLQQLQVTIRKTEGSLGSHDGNTEKKREKRMAPEDSELAYQHKANMMKNLESQNSQLQAEVTLHQKMAEVHHLNNQNRKLQEESKLSQSNVVKLMHRFEKKAKDTEQKLRCLEDEVTKANALAFRYKDMYDNERQRNRGKGSSPRPGENEREKTTMPAISGFQSSMSSSSVSSITRVSDVIRRNENLTEENESLKREIARLRQDNGMLLKKVKYAMADRDNMMHELDTCKMSREDIAKRYQKEKQQHQLLAKSVTRQAQDYVLAKRQQQQLEESSRWRVVYNDRTGPISAYSPVGRSYQSGARSSDQTRSAFPVLEQRTPNESTA